MNLINMKEEKYMKCFQFAVKGLLLLFVGILFSACEASVDPVVVNRGSIRPLKVGNQWVYRTVSFETTGDSTVGTTTVTIVRDTVIQGETWFVDNEGIIQTNRNNGRWVISGEPFLVEQYPAKVNDSYIVNDSLAGVTIRVRAVDAVVGTVIGNVACYVYQKTANSNGAILSDVTLAPNLGLVKLENFSYANGERYVSTRWDLTAASIR